MELNFPKIEQKVLKFWAENKIFEKLRKKNQGKARWSFLDGPITANNPMGVHHAWGRTYKDLFQRYKAMQGFEQRFQNGFDCQGLWVEVEVEKELGFKTKKDIEKYGIDKFVEKCKERVRKYSKIQTEQSIRLGQCMDWENSYYTMSDENNYAIWHFLKKCWQLGYLYKGRDSVPWCPRCGTAISQHEILSEEYQLLAHEAIYFKLPILEGEFEGAEFLVWTTTPWTIPANVVLAVNPELEYGLYENENDKLIMVKNLAQKVLGKDFSLKQTIKGQKIKGIKYEGPFDDLPRIEKARKENPKTFHTVVLDKDLVTALEGTGIVHIAPGAGEEDFKLGMKEKLSVIEVIDESAVYLDDMGQFSGQNGKERPEIILDYLKNLKNGAFFFKTEKYEHRYPTCWRCKKELVWRAVDEWYISMDKLRRPLMEAAKKINWLPSFGQDRELDWLKNMADWLISKKRYWGLALPIFECGCGNFEVIGSKEELKERAAEGWDEFDPPAGGHSPHRPWVDKVKIKCSKCGKPVFRIPDVGNPWLDAGIVPYSTMGYFENKKYWSQWFPADLVLECFPGQFKNWFYSIITMSVVLENAPPTKTIFGHALVRDEKGEEMHKSKGNAIWLDEAVEKIGADAMRWIYVRQNPAYNLKFGWGTAEKAKRKLLILWNSFLFFKTYTGKTKNSKLETRKLGLLDSWILSRLNNLTEKVTRNLDRYNAAAASLAIENFFINDLSLWYIRRSRRRFQRPKDKKEKIKASEVFCFALLNLAKLIAPFLPFLSEEIYQGLRAEKIPESIHLFDWPKPDKRLINKELEEKMEKVRGIVNQALSERARLKIKVRQPLAILTIAAKEIGKERELLDLIKEEVNVRKIKFGKKLKLDTKISKKLKEEGIIREVIRRIQNMRKEAKFTPKDKISINYLGDPDLNRILSQNKKFILKEARAEDFKLEEKLKDNLEVREIDIEEMKLKLSIRRTG